MATCAVEGQAIGTAAAMCVKHRSLPRELAKDPRRMGELQQTLLRDDQSITGIRNEDPLDLARSARVSASGERDGASPAKVFTGITRDIPKGEQHHWAATLGPEGAWLDLEWDRPQRIGNIQLTFDSGFQRELTLTSSDSINRGILRRAQPETVRDYKLLYKTAAGGWAPLADTTNNHQRLVRHQFSQVETRAVRLHITATNGDPLARVFEIRCYA
jgi:hypothetical protein